MAQSAIPGAVGRPPGTGALLDTRVFRPKVLPDPGLGWPESVAGIAIGLMEMSRRGLAG